MKIEELPTEPGVPELVTSEARPVGGLDLLGLRAPAESFALRQLDGVTTITPTIRYLALRCWLIHRYIDRGGPRDPRAFRNFAAVAEAAVVIGNRLAHDDASGLVGSDGAADMIQQHPEWYELRELTKIIASSIYAGPSLDLGLGGEVDGFPSLTRERGFPLAEAVDPILRVDDVLAAIEPGSSSPRFGIPQLCALGERFPMKMLTEPERGILVDALMPAEPRSGEVARLGTYVLLLTLAQMLGHKPREREVHAVAVSPSLDSLRPALRSTVDGWARFLVRDLLVAVHESAMAIVMTTLASLPRTRALGEQVVAAALDTDLTAGLADVGLEVSVQQPIRDLVHAVRTATGSVVDSGDVQRWPGPISELTLLDRLSDFQGNARAQLALLPVAWILAVDRLGPSARSGRAEHDLQGGAATTRLGVGSVLLPEVSAWVRSDEPICEVIGRLVWRTVDQHLRIAWSRLAREQWKDVAVMHTDGSEWIAQKPFRAGRATSRLYQAINWLGQLGLLDDAGVTAAGAVLLDERMRVLERIRESSS